MYVYIYVYTRIDIYTPTYTYISEYACIMSIHNFNALRVFGLNLEDS